VTRPGEKRYDGSGERDRGSHREGRVHSAAERIVTDARDQLRNAEQRCGGQRKKLRTRDALIEAAMGRLRHIHDHNEEMAASFDACADWSSRL